MNEVYKKVCEYIRNYPGGIAWRIKKHSQVIEDHLNPGEEILFIFCGQKTTNPWGFASTCIVAITNKRVMIAQKRVVFGYTFMSITPDMYNDLTVRKHILWGSITIDTVKEEINIMKLSKRSIEKIETEITEYMIREKQKYQTRVQDNEEAQA